MHECNVPASRSCGVAQGPTVWTAVVSSAFMMWMPVFIKPLPCNSYLWLLPNTRMRCWSIYPAKSGLNSLYCLLSTNALNTISSTHTHTHSRCLLIANSDGPFWPRQPFQEPRNLFLGCHVFYLNFERRNLFPVFVPGWFFLPTALPLKKKKGFFCISLPWVHSRKNQRGDSFVIFHCFLQHIDPINKYARWLGYYWII